MYELLRDVTVVTGTCQLRGLLVQMWRQQGTCAQPNKTQKCMVILDLLTAEYVPVKPHFIKQLEELQLLPQVRGNAGWAGWVCPP